MIHWYQQCVALHHEPKCMSRHKAVMVITGRAHCFHDFMLSIYAHLSSARFKHFVRRGSVVFRQYASIIQRCIENPVQHLWCSVLVEIVTAFSQIFYGHVSYRHYTIYIYMHYIYHIYHMYNMYHIYVIYIMHIKYIHR